ncbi:MAG: hypothetical protein WDN10_02945 [bacterium]
MKQLLACVALLVLIGVAGFLYRNAVEHRGEPMAPGATACTLEAKICPDGTAVGRSGPGCVFAPCAFPNIEMGEEGIAYALPAGFAADENAIGAEPTLRAAFVASSTETIVIREYPVPEGKSAEDVMIANTQYESSGNMAESMKEFKPVVVGGKTFYSVTVERFEAYVHTLYYLPRATDVLRFEALDKEVLDWSDPKLVVSELPAHAALLKMLSTLQVSKP